jgi:hypothetical protein
MKRSTFGPTLLALIALAIAPVLTPAASAEMCTIDARPAATLLLPYFEVDLVNQDCITTLFSINNASATPTVAHVTLWTDLSIPVLDFDVYLTGYDVQTINLRDILVHGNLPVTGPTDEVSNRGDFSDPHDNFFGTCGVTPGDPPRYNNPVLSGLQLQHFQTSFLGEQSPVTGDCAGLFYGDDIARGYITIDDTNQCSLEFPADLGYFGPDGTGIASNHNQLWGDFFFVDPQNNFAQGETLVHIEAQDGFIGGPNLYTFYARYTNGAGFADNREPLARTFATRHLSGGTFTGGTDLVVWRDSKSGSTARFLCGTVPVWFPLAQEQIVIFDEEENPVTVQGPPVSGIPDLPDPLPFPAEAQRVQVGGPALPIPAGWENGWLYLDLDQIFFGGYQPVNPSASQAWVIALMSAQGRFSVGFDAIQLDTACSVDNPFPFI